MNSPTPPQHSARRGGLRAGLDYFAPPALAFVAFVPHHKTKREFRNRLLHPRLTQMSPQSGCSYAEVADGYGPTKARFRVKYLPGWTANVAAERLYRGKFAVMSRRHFAIRVTTQT